MLRGLSVAVVAIAVMSIAGAAQAADVPGKAPRMAPVVVATPIQDCSVFYNDYRRRGFSFGVGPGSGLGFGLMNGAMSRYTREGFPDWYGECANWGIYSASGTAFW